MSRSARPDPDSLNWAFLAVSVALAVVHLYLGLLAPFVPAGRGGQFVVVGLALLVGPALYFTALWRPVLYLLGAGFVLYLGAAWLLAGRPYLPFGLLAGGLAVGFVALSGYLFVREESFAERPGGD